MFTFHYIESYILQRHRFGRNAQFISVQSGYNSNSENDINLISYESATHWNLGFFSIQSLRLNSTAIFKSIWPSPTQIVALELKTNILPKIACNKLTVDSRIDDSCSKTDWKTSRRVYQFYSISSFPWRSKLVFLQRKFWCGFLRNESWPPLINISTPFIARNARQECKQKKGSARKRKHTFSKV